MLFGSALRLLCSSIANAIYAVLFFLLVSYGSALRLLMLMNDLFAGVVGVVPSIAASRVWAWLDS